MNGREDELREHAVMLEREVVRLRGLCADLHGALKQLVYYEETRDPNKGALFTAAMRRAQAALDRMDPSTRAQEGE